MWHESKQVVIPKIDLFTWENFPHYQTHLVFNPYIPVLCYEDKDTQGIIDTDSGCCNLWIELLSIMIKRALKTHALCHFFFFFNYGAELEPAELKPLYLPQNNLHFPPNYEIYILTLCLKGMLLNHFPLYVFSFKFSLKFQKILLSLSSKLISVSNPLVLFLSPFLENGFLTLYCCCLYFKAKKIEDSPVDVSNYLIKKCSFEVCIRNSSWGSHAFLAVPPRCCISLKMPQGSLYLTSVIYKMDKTIAIIVSIL